MRALELRQLELRMLDVLCARLLLERDSAVGRREYKLAGRFTARYVAVLDLYKRLRKRARRSRR